MSRITQAVVMLLFGGAIIKSTVTDTFLRYVKEGLRPFLLAAGLLLVAAAIMTIWYDLRAPRKAEADTGPASHDHAPTRGTDPSPDPGSTLREPALARPEPATDQAPAHLRHRADSTARPSGHVRHTATARPERGAPSGAARLDPGSGSSHHEHDDGHGHGGHEPRVGWLVLAPVMALLLLSPPALGSFAAGQSGSVGPAAASDYPPLPSGDPVEVGMLDYAGRAVFDGGRSLSGRNVKLTGFITPGPDGKPMLARMVLACCAADGRPIKIGLTGAPIDAPPDAWVDVVGVYSPQVGTDPVNQAQIAYLDVHSWQEIDQPKQPYT